MKKNFIPLTGIAFLITILAAVGCGPNTGQNAMGEAADDSTKVDIYLKAVVIDGSMHLEMYEEKKSECPVIDGLLTVVYPGYTVTWKKAAESNINQVEAIRPIDDDGNIFREGVTEVESLWTLEVPEDAVPDTVKYEIKFTVKDDKDSIYTIDPYLELPKD